MHNIFWNGKSFEYSKEDTLEGYEKVDYDFLEKHTAYVVDLNRLDTPYYALKMQQEGVYEDYVAYRDELHEYSKEQKAIETAKQEAYQLALAENSELIYEEWLSSYPELMPVHQEPVPSEALQAFYNEYK